MDIFNKKIIPLTIALCAVAVVIAEIILGDIPARDVALRYAPMCEAFAEGDWQYAFHPRIQPLQIVSGGVIAWLFPCSGFMALKIASLLWYIAGGWLIWKLFRELYADKPWIANTSLAFYALFPYGIHMAASGLRESAKTFVLILTAWALVKIFREVKNITGYLLLGIGGALAVLCRADMIMTGIFLLGVGAVIECRAGRWPLLSLISMGLTGGGILLNSALNFMVSGHAMPDYRFAVLFMKTCGRPAQMMDIVAGTALLLLLIGIGAILMALILRKVPVLYLLGAGLLFTIGLSVYTGIVDRNCEVGEFLESVLKGFYHAVGIWSLLFIVYLIYRKRFTAAEFLICLVVLANALFNIVPIQLFHKNLYVSQRYLYVAVPLLAGFFTRGIGEVYSFLLMRFGSKVARFCLWAACLGIASAFVFHAIEPVIKDYSRAKDVQIRKVVWAFTETFRQNYDGPKTRDSRMMLDCYCSRSAPRVRFGDITEKLVVSAYLAGGSIEFDRKRVPDFYVGTTLPKKWRKNARFVKKFSLRKHCYSVWRVKE